MTQRSFLNWCSAAVAAAACVSVHGTPVQWSVNGHWYEAFAADAINWSDASTAATAKGGYLATLTNADENAWVYDNVVVPMFGTGAGETDQAWLGGFQPAGSTEPAGGWEWVTGEAWSYTNWGSGEPNDVNGVEDHLTINRFGDWTWNDEGSWPAGVKGYVVEYVPDGGYTFLLLGLGLLGSGVARRMTA